MPGSASSSMEATHRPTPPDASGVEALPATSQTPSCTDAESDGESGVQKDGPREHLKSSRAPREHLKSSFSGFLTGRCFVGDNLDM